MRFTNPWWLAGGLIACLVLVVMWYRYDARQHAALARFVSAHLRRQLTRSMSITGRRVQRALTMAALLSLFAALAGPQVGYRWEQVSRRGTEIVFAIDTSRSMSTPDVKPDRLMRAKLAIDALASGFDGDAVGIVAFAGSAFLVCPITLDYGAFHETLNAIDTNTVARGGTHIASAIQEAEAALHRRAGGDKILILFTDGEDLEGGALDAAKAAARQGLKIYTVGVGTAAGDLIPVPAEQGGGFVKDDTGTYVQSRLDEGALKAIAAASGGFYVPLGSQGEGLQVILETIGAMAKHDLAYRQQRIYIERYQWPLAASLGFLLASLLVGTRRWSGARRPARSAVVAASTLMLLTILPFHPRAAGVSAQDAQPAAAARDEKLPLVEYNQGTTAYRAKRFPQAAQAFQQSISRAPSSDSKRLADQEDAYYNLGNTLYRTGQATEQSAPKETLQKWNEAVKAYETALQLRADDADSKFNRDLVKRKIDALNQKQNQPQNQPQNKPQNPQQNPPQGGQNPQQGKGSGQPPSSAQPQAGGSQPDKPPQSAGQPPTAPGSPQGKNQPPRDPQQPGDGDGRTADDQRLPGQMSREEARELLDSAKGDERHPLGAPAAQQDAQAPPEKPYKNW